MAVAVCWFRRDLRLEDNHALHQALTGGLPVLPVFMFDKEILDKLPRQDARVEFIREQIVQLKTQLQQLGGDFWVGYGRPLNLWEKLTDTYDIDTVYCNHDYEPYALHRDASVKEFLKGKGIRFETFKDQVIFEKEEILTGAEKPYTVFTPYSKKWKATLRNKQLQSFECESHWKNFYPRGKKEFAMPSLKEMGFEPSSLSIPNRKVEEEVIRQYDERRDFPAKPGTSRLGIHLRFGTISIRSLVRKAMDWNQVYLNELIWREFYMQILWNFPYVVDGPFKKAYVRIPWRQDEEGFERWKAGKTGFPIVDAGMRELNQTGYMHNRVRMITASFLVKDLLVNWQWGESYFAEKLLDFELSSNNGGWQWAAGCGTDAAPYFRIFNPESQMKKFDPQLVYVRKWVPEYGTPLYPKPMVDHKEARKNTLSVYKAALG